MIVNHIGYTVDDRGIVHKSGCRSLGALKSLATRRGHPIILQEEQHHMENDYGHIVLIGLVFCTYFKTEDGWMSPDNCSPSGKSYENVIQVMTSDMFPAIFRM